MNNGGSAFPRPHSRKMLDGEGEDYEAEYGMTLRDWFAGQALAGLLANPTICQGSRVEMQCCDIMAYQRADGMLLQRTKEPTT